MTSQDPQWVQSDFRVRGKMLGFLNKHQSLFLLGLGIAFAIIATLAIGALLLSYHITYVVLSLLLPKPLAGVLAISANTAFTWFCAMLWISNDFREEILTGTRKMLMSGKMPPD